MREAITKHNHELHQSLGLLMLAATGLKHLNRQMVDPMNVVELHRLNAELEDELRENFSGNYIEKIGQDPELIAELVNILDKIESMRDGITNFVKEVNNR